MEDPKCCGEPMEPTPQYIRPGRKMHEASYSKGVPIYICKKCFWVVFSEDCPAKQEQKGD